MTPSLSESACWTLAALAREPLRGGAVPLVVEELSGGELTLRATTSYAALERLERLERSGLVRVIAEEVVDGRARRTYDVTDRGRRVLAQETERLLTPSGAARRAERGRGHHPEPLLRWYPRSWREEHGAVLLGVWQEVLQARGGSGLSRAEARSMRVHGLAERLSLPVAVGLAAAGLVCTALGLAGLFGLAQVPGASAERVSIVPALAQVSSAGLGPALVSSSALALLRRSGVVGAAGTVTAAACSLLAWGLAAVSALSWSVGFDRADAGEPPSAFSAAFPVFFSAAVAVGAAAATPVWNGLLRRVRDRRLRWPVAAACAVPTALVLGLSAVNPGLWPVAAVVLLVVAHRLGDRRSNVPTGRSARPLPAAPVREPRAAPVASSAGAPAAPLPLRRRAGALGALTAVLGVPCTAQALLGDPLGPSFGGFAGLPAMNAGMAAGSLAAIPLVVAVGLLATRRRGRPLAVPTVALVGALVLVCLGQARGPDGSSTPVVAASLLAALAVVLPFAGRLPGGRLGRWALTAVISAVAGWTLTLPLVVLLPLLAPLLAVAFVWWTVRAPHLGAHPAPGNEPAR